MHNLPSAKSVKISFIRPFTLTNFVERYQDLDEKFDFLANSNKYSEYYKNLEVLGSSQEKNSNPIEIDGLGPLVPLKRKHTLSSYWKSFRLPLENDENKANNELFLLLPLKIEVPVKSIKADHKLFPTKLYVYLFPFGSCCINMEINMPALNCGLDKLPELISDLRRSNFSSERKSFEPLSSDIAKKINKALFADEKNIKINSTHTTIFIDTSFYLSPNFIDHKQAIAAIMTQRSIQNVSTQTERKLNEIIKCKLEESRSGEIIIFNSQCTFICPSHRWIEDISKEKKTRKKPKCMYNNYCSFLNLIFSMNTFLEDSRLKDKTPEKRILEIAKCFTKAFPETSQSKLNDIYFGEAFNKVIPENRPNNFLYKLYENLNEIRSKFNE